LNFVDDDRRRVPPQECHRLLLRLFGFGRKVQRDEGVVGKQPAQRGGLAGLSRAREDDNGPGPSGPLEPGLDVSGDPHERIIRLHRILCTPLLELLDRLEPEKRALLVLYYIEGLSVSELAFVLRTAEGTVKSRLHTARTEFRQLWHRESGGAK
jgi:hypothetical protein